MKYQTLLICFSIIFDIVLAQNCVGSVQGASYNFLSLMNNSTDYEISSTGKNPSLIRLNMCRALINLGTPACATGASGCQLWDMPTPKYRSTLGQANTMKITAMTEKGQQGWIASFTGGTGWSGGTVQMEIYFPCQSGGIGTPSLTSSANSDFKFNWPSNVGCTAPKDKKGGSSKVTGGGIFLILLFCGSFVYLAIGVVVNKFVRHQEGIEILPNVAFWTGFGGLIKDGGKFIVNKTCRRGGYTQVA